MSCFITYTTEQGLFDGHFVRTVIIHSGDNKYEYYTFKTPPSSESRNRYTTAREKTEETCIPYDQLRRTLRKATAKYKQLMSFGNTRCRVLTELIGEEVYNMMHSDWVQFEQAFSWRPQRKHH